MYWWILLSYNFYIFIEFCFSEHYVVQNMCHQTIKRQEAIFELWQGERDIVDDLLNVKKVHILKLLLHDGLVTSAHFISWGGECGLQCYY